MRSGTALVSALSIFIAFAVGMTVGVECRASDPVPPKGKAAKANSAANQAGLNAADADMSSI